MRPLNHPMITYTLLMEAAAEAPDADTLRIAFTGQIAGLRCHIDNLVVDGEHRQPLPPTGMQLCAVKQLGFDSLSALHAFTRSAACAEGLAKLSQQDLRVLPLLVLPNEVLPRPARAAGMLKRMGILRQGDGHSPEAFRRWWLDTHGPIAARLPELRGYVQNLVYDVLGDAPLAGNGEPMACDGFTELWFDDAASMSRAFPPRTGTSVTDHASRYIERISTVIVRDVRHH